MILGYTLSGKSSNDGEFFDGKQPSRVLCPNCETCLDYNYVPTAIDVHQSKRYDVSYTIDLRILFSERFVAFCRNALHVDDVFTLVKGRNIDLFYMFPSRILEFDVVRRKTRFEGPCAVCGGFASIVGAHPAYLKSTKIIASGFFRSDIAFASGKRKFPLFFVSIEWKEILSSEKFRGIEFEEIRA